MSKRIDPAHHFSSTPAPAPATPARSESAARSRSRDDARAVLGERARRLARPPEARPAVAPRDFLEVAVAREVVSLEASHVLWVERLVSLSPLPGGPRLVAGITMSRSRIVPVLDLAFLLGAREEGLDDRAWLVVLGVETPRFGLLTGAPRRVIAMREDDIWPRPPEDGRRLISGVSGDAAQVLDMNELLKLKL